jgi:glycosidase
VGTGNIYIDNVILKKADSIDLEACEEEEEEIFYPVVKPSVDRANIIIYEIVPGSYNGGSRDGGNCIKGITSRLDRIKELGINCIWLTPVYDYFKKIIAIRNQYLKSDLNQYWIDNDSRVVYASLSVSGTNKLITVANCSKKNKTVTLDLSNPQIGTINELVELISDTHVSYEGGG